MKKLTTSLIRTIRQDLDFGWKPWRIAERYQVEPALVRKIQYEVRSEVRQRNEKDRISKAVTNWREAVRKLQ